jgi:hypothetical protein
MTDLLLSKTYPPIGWSKRLRRCRDQEHPEQDRDTGRDDRNDHEHTALSFSADRNGRTSEQRCRTQKRNPQGPPSSRPNPTGATVQIKSTPPPQINRPPQTGDRTFSLATLLTGPPRGTWFPEPRRLSSNSCRNTRLQAATMPPVRCRQKREPAEADRVSPTNSADPHPLPHLSGARKPKPGSYRLCNYLRLSVAAPACLTQRRLHLNLLSSRRPSADYAPVSP